MHDNGLSINTFKLEFKKTISFRLPSSDDVLLAPPTSDWTYLFTEYKQLHVYEYDHYR